VVCHRRKAKLLGLGLDGDDGDIRITRGHNFHLVGGSHETHQSMQEKCIKFNEKLKGRGKALEQLRRDEFLDLAAECKMNAIPEDNVRETSKVECIECFSCAETCPPKIKAITYRWRWQPYHTPVDYSRRQFIQTTFGSIVTLGLLSIGIRSKDAYHRMIRPPGSIPEDDFLDKCMRCEACVRICQSNGACLRPDGIRSSLLDLWAPVADMRKGYCEHGCNLCGQVCPTEAILPLTLEQKQNASMGLAYFNKDLCIPYAKYEDCIVCEEHCPTPEKAIKIDEKETVLPDGTVKLLKHPYVVIERCIGCGICEFKCPLPGEAGIIVTGEQALRPASAGEIDVPEESPSTNG